MSDDETPKKKLSAKERIARRKKKKGNKKLISSPSSDDNDKNNGKPPLRGRSASKKRMSRFGGADPLKNAKNNPHIKGTGGISPKKGKQGDNEDNDVDGEDENANNNNAGSDGGSDTDDSDIDDVDTKLSKSRLLAARGMVKSGFSELDFNFQFHSTDGDHEDILLHPIHDYKMYKEHGVLTHGKNDALNAIAEEGLYVSSSTSHVSNWAKDRNTGRMLREVIRHEDEVVRVKKVKNPSNDSDMPAFDVRTGHTQCPPHGTMEGDIFFKGEMKHINVLTSETSQRPIRMNDSDGVGTFEEPLPNRKRILVKRPKPVYALKHDQNKLSRLQVNIGIIGFDDHPLFIPEDKLASQLRWKFAEYTREMRKNTATYIAERLMMVVPAFLQQYKDIDRHRMHDHSRGEKLRRTAIDLIEEIAKYGAQHETDLELNKQLYTCWEALKLQRKKQEFVSTTINVKVKEVKINKLHNNAMKNILKVQKIFMDFFPIMKKYKATSDDTMERFDDVVERIHSTIKIFTSRKQYIFILEESAAKTPIEMCKLQEQKRRRKVNNLRIFGKLYLNGKKVGKTKEASFLSNFRVRLNHTFDINLFHQPTVVKMKICERNVKIPGQLHEVYGTVFLAVPGANADSNPSMTTTALGPQRNIYQFAIDIAMPPLEFPKETVELQKQMSINSDPNGNIKNNPERIIHGFIGANVEWVANLNTSKKQKSVDDDDFKSNLENQIPSKRDTDVLQYGSNLIGAEIKNGDHDEVNSKSVVVNGDELLDKDMLPVVEKMKNIDPNDPAAEDAVRMLNIMSNVAKTGDIFRLQPECVETNFQTSNKHLFKVSTRDLLLSLRNDRPGLFHGAPPIPMTETEIKKDSKLMNLVNTYFGEDRAVDEEDNSFASGYLEDQIRAHQMKVQTFFSRVRAAQSNLARRKSSIAVNVNAVVKQGILPKFSIQLADMSYLFARRRKLRPQPRPRQVQARPKAVYVILNLGRAYNMPIRVSTEAENLSGSPRRGRSPSPGRRGRSQSPSRGRRTAMNNDLGDDEDNDDDDEINQDRDLESLHCYAEITFQGQRVRTHTVSGSSPHFGQNLKIKLNPDGIEGRSLTPRNLMTISDDIRVSLFDKVEMHASNYVHGSRREAILRSESHFLGSFTIPFTTVYMNKQISGLVPIEKPIFSMAYDSQAGEEPETKLRLMIATEPALEVPIDDETPPAFGEDAKMVRNAKSYLDRLRKSSRTKNRNVKVLAQNIDQESLLILRYLLPQKPPKKYGGQKTINTIAEALRYVSLIPFIDDWQAFQGETEVWCTSEEFLELRAGDWEEHAVLLMNYMMYIDAKAGNTQFEHFLVLGRAIPEGETVYVLRKKKTSTDPKDLENPIYVYDASSGKEYDLADPSIPLISIGSLVSTENIYANVQPFEVPNLMTFDVENHKQWRAFFTKKYPKPEVTTCQEAEIEYSAPDPEKAELLEREILETVQNDLRTWRENEVGARRGTVSTRLLRNVGNALKGTLEDFEKALRGEEEFNEDVYRGKLREISNLQGLFHNKSLHGFPINCPFTDMKSILAKVRDTNIHHNEAKDVKFACAVKVFPYPNEIFSVWVFLLSECEKQNTV